MITVAIVEDDSTLREGLAFLIDGAEDFMCIGAYPDCASGVAGILNDPPDVVLMDIGLPDASGIVGVQQLKEELPKLDIVVLTIHRDKQVVFDALCAGACGYLEKSTSPEKLLEAIRETRDGGAPMSSSIARLVVSSFNRPAKDAVKLTGRESEVLQLLCQGKSYKMIAASIFVSEETVHSHIKNIYRKLEVRSKSEAVARALQDNLVPRQV